MNKELIVPEIDRDDLVLMSWQDIADLIWEQIDRDEDLQFPDEVMQAVELLLSGEPRYKVAKKLGVSSRTVKNWLEKYTVARSALLMGQKLLSRWRMAKLEQQFLDAIEVSREVLTADPGEEQTNVKLLGVQAQHARWLIEKMLDPKIQSVVFNINTKEDDGIYKARKEALDYLATKIETIDAEFSSVSDGPEHGHYGVISRKGDQAQCHICGTYVDNLLAHVEKEHNITSEEYEVDFKLQYGSLRKWEATDE